MSMSRMRQLMLGLRATLSAHPAPTDPPAAPAPKERHPFGQGDACPSAVLPGAQRETWTRDTAAAYWTWKSGRPGGAFQGYYRSHMHDGALHGWVADLPLGEDVQPGDTTSRAMGLAMIVTVLLAGPGGDPEAQSLFESLWRTARTHLNPHGLTSWLIRPRAVAEGGVPRLENATEGDMDIAYALLLASEQWLQPLDPAIHYRSEAQRLIDAMAQWNIHDQSDLHLPSPMPSCWIKDSDDPHQGARAFVDPLAQDPCRQPTLLPTHLGLFEAQVPEDLPQEAASINSRRWRTLRQEALSQALRVHGLVPPHLDPVATPPLATSLPLRPREAQPGAPTCDPLLPWQAEADLPSEVPAMPGKAGLPPLAALRWGLTVLHDPNGWGPLVRALLPRLEPKPTHPDTRLLLEGVRGHLTARETDLAWAQMKGQAFAFPNDFSRDTRFLLTMLALSGNWWVPTPPASLPPWTPGRAYAKGDRVSWGGSVWESRFTQTAQPGYEPDAPDTPLWIDRRGHGTWGPGKEFKAGEVTAHRGKLFLCQHTHLSGMGTEPGASDLWVALAQEV